MTRLPSWPASAMGSLCLLASAVLVLTLSYPAERRLASLREQAIEAENTLSEVKVNYEKGVSEDQSALQVYRRSISAADRDRRGTDSELAASLRVVLLFLQSACSYPSVPESLTQYDAAIERVSQGDRSESARLLDLVPRLIMRSGRYQVELSKARYRMAVDVSRQDREASKWQSWVQVLMVLGLVLLFAKEVPIWRKEKQ